MTRHVLSVADLAPAEIRAVLDLSERANLAPVLRGRGVALVFEFPSARTRNAAELAVVDLGGHPVTIRGEEIGFDVRESVEDVARTLGCYHALVAARVAEHATLERMAAALDGADAPVPVVNLLSDLEHPTEALGDLLTIRQCLGSLEGKRIAFVGDANNVCRSLVSGCIAVGAEITVASPPGYQLDADFLAAARAQGGAVEVTAEPVVAVAGADVVYTDVWLSMADKAEAVAKKAAFRGFTLDEALVERAAPGAIVLHCLPAHRGEEITAAVLEGRRSRVWAQATNRRHAMRGLFFFLVESAGSTR
ncbi:MAG TPA: ornithine carbamoyltransferase [Acidimicrobiales bacterium]|nr:ornithine carbamoyltransferase [Acidimicrobiales bacterium]